MGGGHQLSEAGEVIFYPMGGGHQLSEAREGPEREDSDEIWHACY